MRPAVTTFALFTGRWMEIIIVERLEGGKSCFFSCKRQKKRKKGNEIVKRVRVNGKVAMSRNYFSSGIEPTRNDRRDKDNGDLVRVMSRR